MNLNLAHSQRKSDEFMVTKHTEAGQLQLQLLQLFISGTRQGARCVFVFKIHRNVQSVNVLYKSVYKYMF